MEFENNVAAEGSQESSGNQLKDFTEARFTNEKFRFDTENDLMELLENNVGLSELVRETIEFITIYADGDKFSSLSANDYVTKSLKQCNWAGACTI